jgi:ribosome biogenesis GTPase / thiamine phosphate phosphatase
VSLPESPAPDEGVFPEVTAPDEDAVAGPWPLADLGWTDARAAEAATLAPEDTPGRVIRTDRGRCLVAIELALLTVPVHSAPYAPAVGDWVTVDHRSSEPRITAILERTTTFARGAAAERGHDGSLVDHQILATNVDLALVVQAAGQLNPRRLERELLIASGAARSAVVVTKVDLVTDLASMLATFGPVIGDRPLIPVSSTTGVGFDQLYLQLTPGTTLACFGASGVGKSTLINALLRSDHLATGTTRASDGRGRHTTTTRELFPLGDGVTVIDMPGVRTLTATATVEDVDALFEDVTQNLDRCRFADCQHDSEPDCAIRAAIRDGQLSEDRFVAYGELLREATDRRRLSDTLEGRSTGNRRRNKRRDGKRG